MSIAILAGISATLIIIQSWQLQETTPLFGYLFGAFGLAFVFVVAIAAFVREENK